MKKSNLKSSLTLALLTVTTLMITTVPVAHSQTITKLSPGYQVKAWDNPDLKGEAWEEAQMVRPADLPDPSDPKDLQPCMLVVSMPHVCVGQLTNFVAKASRIPEGNENKFCYRATALEAARCAYQESKHFCSEYKVINLDTQERINRFAAGTCAPKQEETFDTSEFVGTSPAENATTKNVNIDVIVK